MEKIREIIRLYEETKLSERGIARALQISRPTVKQYIAQIKSSDLNYDSLLTTNDDVLLVILENNKIPDKKRYETLVTKFEYFAKELKRTNITPLL